jgi:hypothetical protein
VHSVESGARKYQIGNLGFTDRHRDSYSDYSSWVGDDQRILTAVCFSFLFWPLLS